VFRLIFSSYAVLFRDVDEYLDPIVLDILATTTRQHYSARSHMRFGTTQFEIDRNFRMYLTSRLPNPKLLTWHFAYAQVINYTVTLNGLEEQLLSALLTIERRELEDMRQTLIHDIYGNQCEQKQLDECLLRELTTTTGYVFCTFSSSFYIELNSIIVRLISCDFKRTQ
jgi:dynein heavy chain, axonemal